MAHPQAHPPASPLFSVTVKPPLSVPVPPEVVTEIFLEPVVAWSAMVMLTVIWVGLSTVKLLTVIPEPKLTALTAVKLVPETVTE